MAESFVFTIAVEILKKLASTTRQQIDLAVDVKQDLKKLEKTLFAINAVLLDAEQKQSTSHRLRFWLEQLQQVLYDADNILDAFSYKDIQQRLASRGNSKTKVRHIFTGVKFRFKMGYKIKKLRERLDEIESDKAQLHLTEEVIDWHIIPREMTHSFVDPSSVIGRDTDTKYIVDLVTCTHNDRNLSIVPIVGIGGLGKTTIAKLVFHNVKVRECFQLRMWVCVSDDFSLPNVTKDIYQSATNGDDCSGLSFDQLQTRLRNTLKDKKFFLVLDDVWNEDPQEWAELCRLLINGAKGSKIIVTTRSLHVALIMGTTEPYNLKGLSDDDCWSLFTKCAFREGEEKNNTKLEIIGKQIVTKCKGVPLAVRSLGSMLFMKTDERDWLSINKSEIWRLEENKNGILPALRLSYNHLSSHLKRCFSFCSIFPKDFEFNSSTLIVMWMSQGLIQSSAENEELEEIGLRYIKELYSRCFFQDISDLDDDFGGMKFKMHDLVHDLALLVAQNECYTINNHPIPSTVSEKFRNVSLFKREDVPKLFELDLSNLWTLYYFSNSIGRGANKFFVRKCISRFKFLRMLDMSMSNFEVLPSSIGSLYHLRYLDISFNRQMKKLPDAICKLLHLQTLNLDGCRQLEGLPQHIGNLINLRRLWVSANKIYFVPNKQIGLLTSLRDLRVTWCPNPVTSTERMDCLLSLRILALSWFNNLESWPGIMAHLPALETLYIGKCKKLSFMETVVDELKVTSLRSLELSELPELKFLPGWVSGCSDTLRALNISECSNLTCLPSWIQNFKSLHKLRIERCPQVSSLPEEMRHLTSLIELEIIKCSEILNSRCYRGGDWYKISHIRKVTLDGKEMTKAAFFDRMDMNRMMVKLPTPDIKSAYYT